MGPRPGALAVSPQRCSRLPSCAAGPRCVLMGHCGQGRAEGGSTVGARSIRSLPQMARSTRGTAGILRRSRLPSPPEYDLCPRWPHRPGALRVSSRRSHLASTGARRPSGYGGSCEWSATRPIRLSPLASTWSQRVISHQYHSCPRSLRAQPKWRVPAAGNQPMTYFRAVIHRATDPCGAPTVSRAGHRASKIRVIRRLDPGQ